MSDMTGAIVPKSDQLNADDLIGREMTVTITGVDIKGGTEQPVSIHFEGDNGKPYKPCKSMSRVLVSAWGPDSKRYTGRSMTLYRDPKVKWAGMEVGGIRISHMSDIADDMTMALTVTRANKKPFTVRPLSASVAQSKAAPQPLPTQTVSPASAAGAASIAKEPPNCALRGGCVMKPGQCGAVGYCLNDISLAKSSTTLAATLAAIDAMRGQKSAAACIDMLAELDEAERNIAQEAYDFRVAELKAAPKQTRGQAQAAINEMPNDLPFKPTQGSVI